MVIGQTVKMAFVDQNRDALGNEKTVWEDISNGLDIINVGKFQTASRAYAGPLQLQRRRPAEEGRHPVGR